ncbi:hypothetical protein P7K49_001384, partial [Saguinus oedipus]
MEDEQGGWRWPRPHLNPGLSPSRPGAGAGHPGLVVQAERTAEGGAEEAKAQARGRRCRPRGQEPSGLTLSERGGPAQRRARSRRPRLGRQRCSGSARAPPPAPLLPPEGVAGPGRARAVWRRQVLRLQLRSRQLPAPRPLPRGRSPARRLRGLQGPGPPQWAVPLPPGPCLRCLPRLTAGARSVRREEPQLRGTLGEEDDSDSPPASHAPQ